MCLLNAVHRIDVWRLLLGQLRGLAEVATLQVAQGQHLKHHGLTSISFALYMMLFMNIVED